MGKIVKWEDYKDLDYVTIIPSKGRPGELAKVEKMFPNAILFVNKEEVPDYKHSTLPIIAHGSKSGYGDVINKIIENAQKVGIRYVAIFDDDKNKFVSLVGNRERHLDSGQIEEAIAQGCQVLEDLNHPIYLFSTVSSVIKYNQAFPYVVGHSLPQGAMIIRTDIGIKFRVGMFYYEDFDWTMKIVQKYRYMIVCNRYLCISKGEANVGGCNSFRNSSNEERCRQYILDRWGQYCFFSKNSSGNIKPVAAIERKRS